MLSLRTLLLVTALLLPYHAFAEEEPARSIATTFDVSSKPKFSVTAPDPMNGLRVHVNRPVDLKQRGLWAITGYKLRIEPGLHRDPRVGRVGDRDVIYLPAQQYLDDEPNNAGGQKPWVAIDLRTMEVAGRALYRIERNDRFWKPGMPEAWFEWVYGLSLMDGGEIVVDRFKRVAVSKEQQDANTRAQYRIFVEEEAKKKAEQQKLADETRHLKQRVGARLCQTTGDVRLIGFTEQLGKETGKIQIRVTEARQAYKVVAPPLPMEPYVTWDNPDRWIYCD